MPLLKNYSNNIKAKKENDIDWKDRDKELFLDYLLRQRDTRTIWTRRQCHTAGTNQKQGGVTRLRWKSCKRKEVSNRSTTSMRRSKIKQEVRMGQQETRKTFMA